MAGIWTKAYLEKGKVEKNFQKTITKKILHHSKYKYVLRDFDSPPSKKEKLKSHRVPLRLKTKAWVKIIGGLVSEVLKKHKNLYNVEYSIQYDTIKTKSKFQDLPPLIEIFPNVKIDLSFVTKKIGPKNYTASRGETLPVIAAKFYGFQGFWADIADANKHLKKSSTGMFICASIIKLPAIDVPVAFLKLTGDRPKGIGLLPILNEMPSWDMKGKVLKQKIPGGTYLTPNLTIKYGGEIAITIAGGRKGKVPQGFSFKKEELEYKQAIGGADFGFSISGIKADGFMCSTKLGNTPFKLKGKVDLNRKFTLKASGLPIKFSSKGFFIKATMSIQIDAIITPNPKLPKDQPWYEDIGDFVADHALEGVIVIGIILLAPEAVVVGGLILATS